jgi:glucosyl-3-phosphoglycerate synthase
MMELLRRWRKGPATPDLRPRILADHKRGRTISVCIPARNEAATIAPIVQAIHHDLVLQTGLVDEVIVLDHASTDDTAAIAQTAGARVVRANDTLATFGPAIGKGDVLWRSLAAARGDVIVWLDADLESFTSDYVTRLLGPLLLDEHVSMVRATYDRTLNGQSAEGGRVTELTARPALKLLFPELAHVRQPLGGEYAIRRDVAEAVPFEVDYGVEIGLLIDVAAQFGAKSIAQVDLGARIHRNRPLAELHDQAGEVLRAILSRAGHETFSGVVRPAFAGLPVTGHRPAA